jgi:anti-sigma regulatory factor (Ser/Thr protein kinase)
MCDSLPAEDHACSPGSGPLPGTPVTPSHHGRFMQRSSLRSVATLPPEASSVRKARAEASQCVRDWGFGQRLADDAALVTSEIVTNALVASAQLAIPAPVRLALSTGREFSWLLIAVADASLASPLLLPPDGDRIGGRGLALVEAFSTRWGWYRVTCDGVIKVVWAEWSRDA